MEAFQDLLARRAGHARRGGPPALLRGAPIRALWRRAYFAWRYWARQARHDRQRALWQARWLAYRRRIRDRLCRRGGAAVYWAWEWRALRWCWAQLQAQAARVAYHRWLAGSSD